MTKSKRRNRKSKSRLAKLEKQVSDIVSTRELKYADHSFTLAPTAPSGLPLMDGWNVYPLNEIPQGDTHSDREGDLVALKSVRLRCQLIAGTRGANMLRLVVVRMVRYDGGGVTSNLIKHVFAEPFSLGALGFMLTGKKINSAVNYDVLYDKIMIVSNATNQSVGGTGTSELQHHPQMRTFRINLSFKGDKGATQFDPDNLANNAPINGALYICAVSNNIVAGGPVLSVWGRVRYTDS